MGKKQVKSKTFSQKLDKKSENLLYLLSLDSSATISNLARKLGISRRCAELRLNKLYSEGFVKPLLIVNHPGLVKATILIKLTHFDQEIINAIKEIKPLVKLKETLGLYDLSILVATESQKELEEIVQKLNEMFFSSIEDIEIVYHEKEDTLGYKSFCNELGLLSHYTHLNYDSTHVLTDDEKKVLNSLQSYLNINYENLIRETDFGYEKLKKIVSSLLSKGIIRFSVDPDYTKLGLEFHNVLVRVNSVRRVEFEKNILMHPRVHWMKKSKGRWDYILSVTSRDMNEFIDITRELRTKNQNCILDFATLNSKINVMRRY